MKPHPYQALAAHLEELRTARSADNKPWVSVAPLCLATIGMGLNAPEKQLLKVEKALLMAKDTCAAGTVVQAHLYKDFDHSGTVNGSLKDSVPFVRKLLAGEKVAPVCAPTAQ